MSIMKIFSSIILALVGGVIFVSQVKAFEINELKSATGIKAWLVEDHKNPIITIKFAFKGGTGQDPQNKEGLAYLTSGLLDEGAGSIKSLDFQKRLNKNSISMSFKVTRDYFHGSIVTLTETSDEAFRLLRLALISPRFDDESLNRVRNQMVVNLRNRKENPNRIAARAWWKASFGQHLYGRDKLGTETSLNKITSRDLKQFKERIFAQDNLVIGVVGDITSGHLKKKLDEIFGQLPKQAQVTELPNAEIKNFGQTIIVNREIPQSVVVFGHQGVLRSHPDWQAVTVLLEIMAGGFGSRLMKEIREVQGLTYSVSAYPLALDKAGLIIGTVSTVNERVAKSINLIRKSWKKFGESGPTEKEVRDARSYLNGSFGLLFTDSKKIAGILVSMQKNGLDVGYMKRRSELINQVSIRQLKQVAKRLFQHEKLTFSIVGQPVNINRTMPTSTIN
tara:strand:- start:861 stop:2207 length:1347 start_codon:yes stop_codon:yes gene_type:complete